MNKVLTVDPLKCTGCCRCEAVCSLNKRGAVSVKHARVRVMRYDEDAFFFPVFCLQCEEPACVKVCPSGALRKNPLNGLVDLTEDKCVGCKMCLIACPFGAIQIVDGKSKKCDLCGGDPTCVQFCEPKALIYGEADAVPWSRRVKNGRQLKEELLAEQKQITNIPT